MFLKHLHTYYFSIDFSINLLSLNLLNRMYQSLKMYYYFFSVMPIGSFAMSNCHYII